MPVQVTTNAVANTSFRGKVKRVAIMPTNESRWLNPDRKVYDARIAITSQAEKLRPGMSCSAQIMVQQFDDALDVPIQAVVRVGGQPRG